MEKQLVEGLNEAAKAIFENNKAKGQTLTNYEEKNIKSRSLKRILKK